MMKQRGFTLVELMLVVIIIAILGIIGLPSYREYVQRSQRTEAKDAVLRVAANEERFYLQNNTYTADLAELGFPDGLTDTGLYELVVVADQLGFTVTAAPAAGAGMSADDECQQFAIDETSTRTAAPDPNGRCW